MFWGSAASYVSCVYWFQVSAAYALTVRRFLQRNRGVVTKNLQSDHNCSASQFAIAAAEVKRRIGEQTVNAARHPCAWGGPFAAADESKAGLRPATAPGRERVAASKPSLAGPGC